MVDRVKLEGILYERQPLRQQITRKRNERELLEQTPGRNISIY